jgi:NAD(P)-dependent dehydrogenase (short-subunit alcohol dehydrogenase family)
MKNIAVIGSSGAIGGAFVTRLALLYPNAVIHGFSRSSSPQIDYQDEASIKQCATLASQDALLDMVIVATGILCDGDILPEKSLKELSAEKFQHLFMANTIVPALIAKHFLPLLNKNSRSIFAVLSARVGSISDNYLGGWYAYRASKAALNMVIKNAAIEVGRRNKQAIIVGLHPGTVDSKLSQPFQSNLATNKLFTPQFSVEKMLRVLDNLNIQQSGKCFAYNGKEVLP